MHSIIQNYLNIQNTINSTAKKLNLIKVPELIVVSKTFGIDKIKPLVDHGHHHFGENKVQESVEKWSEIKKHFPQIKLHLLGHLQTNKVKFAVKLFDYIHTVDNEKLVKKILDEQTKQNKKVNAFIQLNLGNEIQKSGISENDLPKFYEYSKNQGLNVIGLMCIPPAVGEPIIYFKRLQELKKKYHLSELSMGMSSDYIDAIKCETTFLRIGSKIFGKRS